MKNVMIMLAVVAMLAMTAGADVITVNNHSFETPTLGDGSYSANSVSGWGGSTVQYGVMNPVAATVNEETVDGSNVVYMNRARYMYQDTGVNFVEGKIYKLTVAVAKHLGHSGYSPLTWEITLVNNSWDFYTDAQLLGTIGDGDPEDGVLTDKVLTFECTAASGLVGDEIRILIRRPLNVSGAQSYFDNVRLTYVPEPATMALLGIGGIGVLIRRKRR